MIIDIITILLYTKVEQPPSALSTVGNMLDMVGDVLMIVIAIVIIRIALLNILTAMVV